MVGLTWLLEIWVKTSGFHSKPLSSLNPLYISWIIQAIWVLRPRLLPWNEIEREPVGVTDSIDLARTLLVPEQPLPSVPAVSGCEAEHPDSFNLSSESLSAFRFHSSFNDTFIYLFFKKANCIGFSERHLLTIRRDCENKSMLDLFHLFLPRWSKRGWSCSGEEDMCASLSHLLSSQLLSQIIQLVTNANINYS